jgi:Lectin C-type domain
VWGNLPVWQQTGEDKYTKYARQKITLMKLRQVTWQKNLATCCSLGMTPLTLDSVSEQECLSNMMSTNWTGNYNYWTGGTQQECRGSWGWCGPGSVPRGVADDLKWEPGQPDNLGGRQDCVHIKNFNTSGLLLTDRNCTDKYIVACKVKMKIYITNLNSGGKLIHYLSG